MKTKHEKKYPLVSLSVPKCVSPVLPAKSPGVKGIEIGVEVYAQWQDLNHNIRRETSPAGVDRSGHVEPEEPQEDWDLNQDEDENDFNVDHM